MSKFGENPQVPRNMDNVLQNISDLKKQEADLDKDEFEVKMRLLLDEASVLQNPNKDKSLTQDVLEKNLNEMAESQLPAETKLEDLINNMPDISQETKKWWQTIANFIETKEDINYLKKLQKTIEAGKNMPEEIKSCLLEKLAKRLRGLRFSQSEKEETLEDEILADTKEIDAFMDKGDGVEYNRNLDKIKNPDTLRQLIESARKNKFLNESVRASLLTRLHNLLNKIEGNND